ncbi:MAG: putative Ig domain-containing protein, partial [Planctomycetales bacterium]|nr:putative Ig domain-containing protein [Planctomycetales bacterium]
MSEREKKLAMIVGGLLGLVALFFGYQRLDSSTTRRENELAAVQAKIDELEKERRRGSSAAVKLNEFEKQSLPRDRELAVRQYDAWLTQTIEKIGFKERTVKFLGASPQQFNTNALKFQIYAQGNIAQLTEFLYEFKAANMLHQITSMPVKPVADSRDLKIDITIEALALSNGPPQLDAANRRKPPDKSLQQYADAIVGRNIFAPPNNPPRMASISDKRVSLGDRLSVQAEGNDSDPLDSLSYSLGEPAPSGATIDPQSGEIRWSPRENGTYDFAVRVTDDGFPAKSVQQTFRVSVVDPPPPPPIVQREPPREERPRLQFDEAKHTYLVATI